MAKLFDLEERTLAFSKDLLQFCSKLQKNSINNSLIDQVVRSGTSIGANYREANDALGKKDFVMRIKISRKEAKETIYWLDLLFESNKTHKMEIEKLLRESVELKNILSAIINKSI